MSRAGQAEKTRGRTGVASFKEGSTPLSKMGEDREGLKGRRRRYAGYNWYHTREIKSKETTEHDCDEKQALPVADR